MLLVSASYWFDLAASNSRPLMTSSLSRDCFANCTMALVAAFVGGQARRSLERASRGEVVAEAAHDVQRGLGVGDLRHQQRARAGLSRVLAARDQDLHRVRATRSEQSARFVERLLQPALGKSRSPVRLALRDGRSRSVLGRDVDHIVVRQNGLGRD
jgi:hypothetical protein